MTGGSASFANTSHINRRQEPERASFEGSEKLQHSRRGDYKAELNGCLSAQSRVFIFVSRDDKNESLIFESSRAAVVVVVV